jgi:hypothetical protein
VDIPIWDPSNTRLWCIFERLIVSVVVAVQWPDHLRTNALKFNLDLEEYFSAVSTRFQSASAIIIATMNGSNGPILTRMIDAIRTNRNRFIATAGGLLLCVQTLLLPSVH